MCKIFFQKKKASSFIHTYTCFFLHREQKKSATELQAQADEAEKKHHELEEMISKLRDEKTAVMASLDVSSFIFEKNQTKRKCRLTKSHYA